MLEEFTNQDLIDELIKRGVSKSKSILVIWCDDDTGINAEASAQANCYGLASWYIEVTKQHWRNEV